MADSTFGAIGSDITLSTSQSVRRNSANNAFEAFTPATGNGSVTTVSVVTANGVSGSVATATTTPAITLALGAITPSSIAGTTFSGNNTFSGTNGFTILPTSAGTPTGNTDLVNKLYTDTFAQGLTVKPSCIVATTANVALTGEQTIDGVLTSTSRILVKNQTAPAENGIYVTAAGAWTRAADYDQTAEVVQGTFTAVISGTTQSNTLWVQTTAAPTINVDPLVFSQLANITVNQGTVTGTGTANQISFWSSTTGIAGDTGLTYNSSTNVLSADTLQDVNDATGSQLDLNFGGNHNFLLSTDAGTGAEANIFGSNITVGIGWSNGTTKTLQISAASLLMRYGSGSISNFVMGAIDNISITPFSSGVISDGASASLIVKHGTLINMNATNVSFTKLAGGPAGLVGYGIAGSGQISKLNILQAVGTGITSGSSVTGTTFQLTITLGAIAPTSVNGITMSTVVIGPSSATDNAIARYDTTTGKLIQDSLASIDDNGRLSVPTGTTTGGIKLGAANYLTEHTALQFIDWQRIGTDYTLMRIKAPTGAGNTHEATIALLIDRDENNSGINEEFVDFYNEHYSDSVRAGIRVIKTGTGSLKPFVIGAWSSSGAKDLGDGLIVFPYDAVVVQNSLNVGQNINASTVTYSRFGTGSTSHSLAIPDDVLVSNLLEVNGNAFFDGFATVATFMSVGGSASAGTSLLLNGTGFTNQLFAATGSISPVAGTNGTLARVTGTIVEAASGNHTLLSGTFLGINTVTSGAATVTNTATLFIEGPMTATVSGTNYGLWVDAGTVRLNGAVQSETSIGYKTNAGGTVTQLTSKATAVTLNKICGQIVMNAAALAAGAEVSFTLTNSTIVATDVVIVNIQSVGTVGSYAITVSAVAAGSCQFTLTNLSVGSLSQAVVLSYAIIKAVIA